MKLYQKILASLGALLAIGAFIYGAALSVQDAKLESCFASRQIEWSFENRASEAAKRGVWGWKDTHAQKASLGEAMGCNGELGFSVVTDFQKQLSSPMTNNQTFVPLTSMTLRDGGLIDINTLGYQVFLTIEPGLSGEEIVMCTDVDLTLKRFTNCTRGLAFSGTSTAGVVANAKTHSSGSNVVMSNVHYVYNNYVDKITTSTQSVAGVLNFSLFPRTTSTTAIPSNAAELATKYYVDNVGAGGFTCSNVSSTLGLQCLGTVPEKVGVNASNTTGIGFSSSSGKLYLNVSSTGGLVFDSSMSPYGLYFDKTRDYTFTGNLTAAGSLTVNTPTQNGYATNKSYVDYSLQTNNATGTAGENVTSGQFLYASSTGALYLADADATTSTYSFVGIALNTTNTSGIVTYARPGGIVTNQSGLTAGQYYYISGTPGSIVTPGASGKVFARVGFALSATSMLIMQPTFEQMAVGTTAVTYNGSTSTVTLGFVPKEVELYCIGNNSTAGNSHGYFAWDQSGAATQVSQGVDDDTSPFTMFTTNRACKWQQGGADEQVIVATTTNGFSLSGVGSGVTQNVYWRAKYWDNGFGGN